MGRIKIGVLCVGYECDQYIDRVLAPWVEVKKDEKYQFIFSCVYGQFKEWAELFGAKESAFPQWKEKYQNLFDYFMLSDPKEEKDLRDIALKPLLAEECDYILMLDLSDEFYKKEQILASIEFMERYSKIYFFDVAFRNFIFDEKHHLDATYFKRFFRNSKADPIIGMRFDCDYIYKSGIDDSKPKMRIPPNIIYVDHYSWFSDERGKRKVKYQQLRWGETLCSYKWNEEKNRLELNEKYYEYVGKPMPRIYELKNI